MDVQPAERLGHGLLRIISRPCALLIACVVLAATACSPARDRQPTPSQATVDHATIEKLASIGYPHWPGRSLSTASTTTNYAALSSVAIGRQFPYVDVLLAGVISSRYLCVAVLTSRTRQQRLVIVASQGPITTSQPTRWFVAYDAPAPPETFNQLSFVWSVRGEPEETLIVIGSPAVNRTVVRDLSGKQQFTAQDGIVITRLARPFSGVTEVSVGVDDAVVSTKPIFAFVHSP